MYNKQQRKVLAIYNKAHDVLCNFLEITIWFFWIRAQFTAASNRDFVAQQNKEGKNSRFQKDRKNKLYCKYFSNFGVFFYFLIRLILLSNLTCPAYIVIKQIHTYLENWIFCANENQSNWND